MQDIVQACPASWADIPWLVGAFVSGLVIGLLLGVAVAWDYGIKEGRKQMISKFWSGIDEPTI